MITFSSIEYSQMKTSIDDKMADTNKDLPEYEQLELISNKLGVKVEETKKRELEQEENPNKGNNKKEKRKYNCSNCNAEVGVKMVKQCEVCGEAGDNIRQILLPN